MNTIFNLNRSERSQDWETLNDTRGKLAPKRETLIGTKVPQIVCLFIGFEEWEVWTSV
jgi:hypothetical protein